MKLSDSKNILHLAEFQSIVSIFPSVNFIVGIYLMVVLTMSCLSILSSVAVLSLHHQRGKPRQVPKIIRCIAFTIVARVLCLKLKSTKRKRNSVRQHSRTSKKSFSDIADIFQLDSSGPLNSIHAFEEYETSVQDEQMRDVELRHLQERQEAVNELIHWLHRKHKAELSEDVSFQEWRDVAFVVDRLLFVLFLILNIIATAVILTMRPAHDASGFVPISVSDH